MNTSNNDSLKKMQSQYRLCKLLKALIYITVSAVTTIGFCTIIFSAQEKKTLAETQKQIPTTRTETATVWEGCVQMANGEVYGYDFAKQPEIGTQVTVVFDTNKTQSIYDDAIVSVY